MNCLLCAYPYMRRNCDLAVPTPAEKRAPILTNSTSSEQCMNSPIVTIAEKALKIG